MALPVHVYERVLIAVCSPVPHVFFIFANACAPLCSGRPSHVPQDGLRLRQPQRRPVLLPRVRPPAEQPVSAPERPAHLRQRRHMGGELPAVPVPGERGRIACGIYFAGFPVGALLRSRFAPRVRTRAAAADVPQSPARENVANMPVSMEMLSNERRCALRRQSRREVLWPERRRDEEVNRKAAGRREWR